MKYERFVIEVYVYTGATSVNALGQYMVHDGKNELIKAIAEHSESRLVAVIPWSPNNYYLLVFEQELTTMQGKHA